MMIRAVCWIKAHWVWGAIADRGGRAQARRDKGGWVGGRAAGLDNAGGDIAVYPMLLGQLPGETCSSCKSFKSSFVHHIDFASVLNPWYLLSWHCHICASPILLVLVPIRGVHVIRGEGANLLGACSYTLQTEVTFQYLPPSIFWLEENASYHFSNLVTWLSYLQMAFL